MPVKFGTVDVQQLGRLNVNTFGSDFNKLRIKRVKGAVTARGCEVESICEIHAGLRPIKRLRCDFGIFESYPCNTGKASKCFDNLTTTIVIAAAQNPLCFEQDGRGNKDVASFNQRLRFGKLLWIVLSKKTDEDVGINGAHDARLPVRPPCPFLQWI